MIASAVRLTILGVVYAVILPSREIDEPILVVPVISHGALEIAPLPLPTPKHVRRGRPIEQILRDPLGGTP